MRVERVYDRLHHGTIAFVQRDAAVYESIRPGSIVTQGGRAWSVQRFEGDVDKPSYPSPDYMIGLVLKGDGLPAVGEELERSLDVPVPLCAEPGPTATCSDPPIPSPIDVAALSVGRPDGVYFAGKRFYRVSDADYMAYRRALGVQFTWQDDALRRHEQLGRRIAGQTLVVRWEIANGRAGEFERVQDRLTDGVTPPEHRFFAWGPERNDMGSLHHAICGIVDRCREANVYIDAFAPIWNAAGDEWVLSHAELRAAMAREDTRRTTFAAITEDGLTRAQVIGVVCDAAARAEQQKS